MYSPPVVLSLLIVCLSITNYPDSAHASVPPSARFRYVNEGELGQYIMEYDGDYRVTDIFASPFQLVFYNTTQNEFILTLRMGLVRSESVIRVVWEANRGNPVGENATFTLGEDGNLVLAHADGRIAWQTNTANKGVVGFKLLPTGNMVLHDSRDRFLWQSFDHPTDTLLVGQSLKRGAAAKLVSRVSREKSAPGAYSLVLEPKTLSMYYTSPNSPQPLLYYSFSRFISVDNLEHVTVASDLGLEFGEGRSLSFRRAKYNTTLSFLRLGIDGNLRFYTYELPADYRAWEVSYTLFARNGAESECQLPERCGDLGVCEDSQCVACPSPNGLLGWNKNCKPTKISCGAKNFKYYEVQGVDHFLCKYTAGDGPLKQEACASRCSSDCKCLGYFYRKESSRCWIAHDLKTMTRVGNSTHVAYIKTPTV